MKKNLIFDLDWTLIESMSETLNIVVKYILDNFENKDQETVRYYMSQSAWTPLLIQLQKTLVWETSDSIQKACDDIYEEIWKHNWEFFEWVPEKIKELSKTYKLFLTTWNSTYVAKKYLTKWWIIDLFEVVLWSDKILKWNDHLENFKEYSEDENFYENSYYIWDGNSDREFAEAKDIEFIHIWNEWIDKYEIKSVINIDNILK